MRHRIWAVAAIVLPLVAACAGQSPGSAPGADSSDPRSARSSAVPGEPADVATGLEVPWGIAFLPDGSALVTERDNARILRVSPEGSVQEAGTVSGVDPGGEGGLLGIAVSPDYESDSAVYAYYTSESDNRIVGMSYDQREGLGEQEVLVKGIPSSRVHNGGRLRFGPDGMLYAGTGDGGQGELAQDTESLGGKILRMTPEGEPAPGNPFGNLVYSYGHRNVQGLAWDTDATMYGIEFGQNRFDEVNIIEPGANYGWPEVEGVGESEEYTDPVRTWSTEEASPSGAAVAGGSLWVAALRGERLWRVPLTGDGGDGGGGDALGVGEPEALYEGEYGRLRAVAVTPDGSALWVTTSNRDGRGDPAEGDDRILRVPLTSG